MTFLASQEYAPFPFLAVSNRPQLGFGKRVDCRWRGVRKSLGELRVTSSVPTLA